MRQLNIERCEINIIAIYNECYKIIYHNMVIALGIKLRNSIFLMKKVQIYLAPIGVLVSGRYRHGKPTKPVNTALSALHSFQSYIISVCFYGHFYICKGTNGCSGVVLPDSIYSQAKVGYYHGNPDTRTETAVLSRKSRYYQAKPLYEHGNCLYYHGNPMGVFVII